LIKGEKKQLRFRVAQKVWKPRGPNGIISVEVALHFNKCDAVISLVTNI